LRGTVSPWPSSAYFTSNMAARFADYQKIISELHHGQLRPLYWCKGADYYLYRVFVEEMRKSFFAKYGKNADFVQRWGIDLKAASDVSALLGGGGLFSSASLVVLHEIQDAGTSVKTKLSEVLSRIPPDTIVMVHYSSDDFRKAKWLDAMDKAGQTVALSRPDVSELPRIILEMGATQGLELEKAAVFRLMELSSGELAIIENELEKITLYLDTDQKKVDQALVDTVAGSIENAQVFQFIDAVSRRDRKGALQTLVEIHHQGKEGLPYLVALLYNRLTQLMALKESPEARKTINRESTSAYFLRTMSGLANNYTLPELQLATRHLAELDLKFRLGSMDLLTSFSGWISKVL
jgi:DNA polymerase III delta subunit